MGKAWCPGAESNHRHCDFQSHALPTELPGRRGPPKGRAKQSARFIEAGFPPVQTSCWAVGKRSKRVFRWALTPSPACALCTGALILRCSPAWASLEDLILRSARRARLEGRGRASSLWPSFEMRASHALRMRMEFMAPQDEAGVTGAARA